MPDVKRLAAMRRLLSKAKGFVPKHQRELHEEIRAALARMDAAAGGT